jgi:hypothetical protein
MTDCLENSLIINGGVVSPDVFNLDLPVQIVSWVQALILASDLMISLRAAPYPGSVVHNAHQ